MKPVITIKASDGTIFSIAVQHITYVEHGQKGCIIHINGGGENVAIATTLKWEEVANAIGLK